MGLLANVQEAHWNQHPIPNEWSVLQILCHMYETESLVQRQRLKQILALDNPFLSSMSPPGPNIPLCSDDAYWIAEQFVSEREHTIPVT